MLNLSLQPSCFLFSSSDNQEKEDISEKRKSSMQRKKKLSMETKITTELLLISPTFKSLPVSLEDML